MEHIKQHDWCSSEPDVHFLSERDMNNSVTERILRNKFHDPLLSSESEDESKPKVSLDWDEIFNKNKMNKTFRKVVQGIHPVPMFTKLSALNSQQHYQCLKVLCSENPNVMPGDFFPRPTKQDHRHFEELKEIYLKEQKEFQEWARSLWVSNHCVRALRPKPPIETVYEAEFKIRAHSLKSFPKLYSMAAQIALESPNQICDIIHMKEIIKVNMSTLPMLQYPDMNQKVTIMKSCPVPEPCTKHPCKFVLPTETAMTLLPMTEIHKELAQFAYDNGATNIASENALKCLMQKDRYWTLPVSVCEVITADGDKQNVVVLGSEFSMLRETAPMRTYKAFKRLLEHALISPVEVMLLRKANDAEANKELDSHDSKVNKDLSDDEDDNLYIDMMDETDVDMRETSVEANTCNTRKKSTETQQKPNDSGNRIDFYNCTCKDTLFEKPPLRSYRRWRVRNKTTGDSHDIIVHVPHKVRGHTGEVILEPIPEYQIDLGASEQSPDVTRSLALSLLLRRHASVLNVRIDSPTGDIVTTEAVFGSEARGLAERLHAALAQLAALRPARYLLHHEPIHGNNALLYSSKLDGRSQQLSLDFDCSQLAEADEAKSIKTPPSLIPVLLPVHKFRRILPCAFTPYPNQLAKEPKKPVSRQKTPPQAIRLGDQQSGARRKWPKRKPKKKKNN